MVVPDYMSFYGSKIRANYYSKGLLLGCLLSGPYVSLAMGQSTDPWPEEIFFDPIDTIDYLSH